MSPSTATQALVWATIAVAYALIIWTAVGIYLDDKKWH